MNVVFSKVHLLSVTSAKSSRSDDMLIPIGVQKGVLEPREGGGQSPNLWVGGGQES